MIRNNTAGVLFGTDIRGTTIENCTLVGNGSGLWSTYPNLNSTLRNNVIVASGAGNYAIRENGLTFSESDYNDLVAVDGAKLAYLYGDRLTLADWQARSGLDTHSISVDPMFADPVGGDFHLLSSGGRYDLGTSSWISDAVNSPAIDAGDPASTFANEPAPNGGRINLGAYGNTEQASKSDETPPGVVAISVSDTLISDADTGEAKTFTVSVDFSEAMNTTVDPTISFGPSHQGTLSNPSGSWTDSDTFVATYVVSDQDVDVRHIQVDVTGAEDAAGNAQADYTPENEFDIDTSNPAAPVVTGITDDTGTAGDGITSDTTLVISGTAEVNSSVQVFKDGTSIGTTAADGIGVWSLDYTGTTLGEGSFNLTAKAIDAAGNVSVASPSFSVTIDTTAPTVTVTPDDDATNVAIDTDLTITFNQIVQTGSGDIVIRTSTGDVEVERIRVGDLRVTIDGTIVTIDPLVTLAEDTGYYVEVAAGGFVDLAGNPFSGISGDAAWNFTTREPLSLPVIVVGHHIVGANASSVAVPIYVTGGQAVTGLNLRAQLGDGLGTGVEPVFSGMDFAGGIWDACPNTVTGGPVAGATQVLQASVVFNSSGDAVAADGLFATLLIDTRGFTGGTFELRLSATGIGTDTAFVVTGGDELAANITNGTITIGAEVVDRHVFYNQSYFDGNNVAANAADDNAIATDKHALLPAGTATFDNYTNYHRGINGIMVDIAGLADAASLDATHFEFRVGNTDDPTAWAAGPTPTSITVRAGAGADGSDRVTLIWPDGAIQKQWLQITVKEDGVTGLAAPDVFYFGNAVGDSGNSTANTFVDGTDFAGARDNPRNVLDRAPIDFRWDYNRDSFVDGSDLAIARDNNTNFLTDLELIDLSVPGPSGATALGPQEDLPQGEGESDGKLNLLSADSVSVYGPWTSAQAFANRSSLGLVRLESGYHNSFLDADTLAMGPLPLGREDPLGDESYWSQLGREQQDDELRSDELSRGELDLVIEEIGEAVRLGWK